MENIINKGKTYQHLIRLDEGLNSKLFNHMVENEMTLAGVIRKSLRQFFQSEDLKKETIKSGEKRMSMK